MTTNDAPLSNDESQDSRIQIQKIEQKVLRREQAYHPMFRRMDEDTLLYNLHKVDPPQGDGIRSNEVYVSSRPRVFADKLIGSIASAEQIVTVPSDADNVKQREENSNYERLGIGFLEIANQNEEREGRIPIRTSLAGYAITQGGYVATRALLRKDEEGETIVDITPISPRRLLIQFGDREPLWAAIVTHRDRASIRDEYPGFKFDDEDRTGEDESMMEKVIDYYWKEKEVEELDEEDEDDEVTIRYMNAVIVEGKWAKEPTDTFATMFPIIARAVGSSAGQEIVNTVTNSDDFPGGATSTLSGDTTNSIQIPGVLHFAESAFASIRNLNPFVNRLNSYRMANARRAVLKVQKVFSSDGTKELDSGIDEDATEVSLSVENQEDVVPMEVQEMTRDIDSLSGIVGAEYSDATLPEQAFGRLPAPISGNALRILGAAEGQRLEPFLRPIESCLEGTIEALASQYDTGSYKPVKVTGRTRDRDSFSREITPEDIDGRDEIRMELVVNLPQDIQERYLTAQIATQPGADGLPLNSTRTAREDILKMPDADLESERVFAQMAMTSTPKMALLMQWIAAQEAGEEEVAAFLQRDLQRLIDDEATQRFLQRIQTLTLAQQNPMATIGSAIQGATDVAQNPQAQNPLRGIQPEMLGLTGVAPGSVQPSPDAGANTTAPRQTADDTEARANAIGLTLARR